jgi:opacity protein-like surface antigen
MKKFLTIFCFTLLSSTCLVAQDDLMKELEQSQQPETNYAFQTFKGTRLVNGHTVETKASGTLEFIFAHRFGAMNGGLYELFGLDEAYVRLGLDYGITDKMSVSIGRNSVDKTVDGYLKYKLARQSKGVKNFPVTIAGLAGLAYQVSPRKEFVPVGFENIDRLAYVGQLLMARKFTRQFSFQVMPTIVHKNAVDRNKENNDQLAIGAGGRYKITKSVALKGEYYYRLDVPDANPSYNALGFGVDIETGGHVFQILITNTRGLTERAFIAETEGDFADGDIHLGFNVTRTFQIRRKE